MVQIPEKTLTLEAFLQLPETKPASEYIDDKSFKKPCPRESTAYYRANW